MAPFLYCGRLTIGLNLGGVKAIYLSTFEIYILESPNGSLFRYTADNDSVEYLK